MSLKLDGKFLNNIFEQEELTGTVDGVNDDFTLSSAPLYPKAVLIFLDGRFQTQGLDYTISGTTVTMSIPPAIGQSLASFYFF